MEAACVSSTLERSGTSASGPENWLAISRMPTILMKSGRAAVRGKTTIGGAGSTTRWCVPPTGSTVRGPVLSMCSSRTGSSWEAQRPTIHASPRFPRLRARGCPRGVSASWYVYSPLRVKYPYIRGKLLEMWKAAKQANNNDPVAAWEAIQSDPAKRKAYQQARGKGGFVRFSWDEASEIIAASLISTIKKHGPDRIFGFTPLPAMSMTSFASGARFLSMLGASMVSFYDWYCDLPPASPQIWGEQTDVPESADWYVNALHHLVGFQPASDPHAGRPTSYVEAWYQALKLPRFPRTTPTSPSSPTIGCPYARVRTAHWPWRWTMSS